jgi:hypothetical protein
MPRLTAAWQTRARWETPRALALVSTPPASARSVSRLLLVPRVAMQINGWAGGGGSFGASPSHDSFLTARCHGTSLEIDHWLSGLEDLARVRRDFYCSESELDCLPANRSRASVKPMGALVDGTKLLRSRSPQQLVSLILLSVSCLTFSWIAFFNRAPLVFPDTIAYATAALRNEVPGMFSGFYSYLI